MKSYWQQLAGKFESLTLRERAIVFLLASLLIVCFFTVLIFDRYLARISDLTTQISRSTEKDHLVKNEVAQASRKFSDPDLDNRQRLSALKQQLPVMQETLVELQKGLVSPEKMPSLLRSIVKGNAGVDIVSLKTLPVENLVARSVLDSNPSNVQETLPAAAVLIARPDTAHVYTHGVEIVVEGSYLEILNYIRQLENMPWQLLWGDARLEVNNYPSTTMTLTVFSLSLDRKWLNL